MEKVLRDIGVGLRPINDPFFEDSYRICKVFQRKGITVVDEEELYHEAIKEFPCYNPGCLTSFKTLVDFEMHYNTTHRYVCTECKKTMPNPRLLDIHIQETHDSFFQVMSAKRPMFQCYVSECDLKFNDPVERRNHCVNEHKFPKNFRFDNAMREKKQNEPADKMDVEKLDEKNKKTKGKKVQLNKNQKARMFTPASKTPVPETSNSGGVQTNSSAPGSIPSSLTFVPRQVQKSYTRALTNNQSNERNVLETENMMDLADSLPQ